MISALCEDKQTDLPYTSHLSYPEPADDATPKKGPAGQKNRPVLT